MDFCLRLFAYRHFAYYVGSPNLSSPTVSGSLMTIVFHRYYFDGKGKSFRPRLAAAMAQAINAEFGIPPGGNVYYKQLQVRSFYEDFCFLTE